MEVSYAIILRVYEDRCQINIGRVGGFVGIISIYKAGHHVTQLLMRFSRLSSHMMYAGVNVSRVMYNDSNGLAQNVIAMAPGYIEQEEDDTHNLF